MNGLRLGGSLREERGASLILIAGSLMMLLGIAALAVDIGFARSERLDLQNAADAGALAGSFELPDEPSTARAAAAEYAYLGVDLSAPAGIACGANTECFNSGDFTVRVTTPYSKPGSSEPPAQQIRVQMCSASPTFFGRVLGASEVGICGDAVAVSGPGLPACVLCVLSPSGTTFTSTGGGTINVTGGNIQVNSTSPTAVKVSGAGHVSTDQEFGLKGGYSAPSGALSPTPTYHDVIADPLSSIPPPVLSGTPAPKVSISGTADVTLSPGIYSEIVSSSTGQITLQPGIYVVTKEIKLSKSPAVGKVSLKAHGVMVYFACASYPTPCASGQAGASLSMSGATTVSWIPPDSGTYKGISIFFDRNNTGSITLTGGSGNYFAGSVYAKSGTLNMTGDSAITTTMNSMIVVGKLNKSGDSSIDISYDKDLAPPGAVESTRKLIG